jgi:hypothetical protein
MQDRWFRFWKLAEHLSKLQTNLKTRGYHQRVHVLPYPACSRGSLTQHAAFRSSTLMLVELSRRLPIYGTRLHHLLPLPALCREGGREHGVTPNAIYGNFPMQLVSITLRRDSEGNVSDTCAAHNNLQVEVGPKATAPTTTSEQTQDSEQHEY